MEDIPTTALLVMDVQEGILRNYPESAEFLAGTASAIRHARAVGTRVIYVVVGFREGTPEVSADNRMFASVRQRMEGTTPEEWMRVDPAVAPQSGEITVVKRRVSAFTGSDLEVVLRAQRIGHLVLTGIATSGVVLSTLREAADRDYRITVLADCCADADPEVHRVLTEKVFPRQAEVLNVAEWIGGVGE